VNEQRSIEQVVEGFFQAIFDDDLLRASEFAGEELAFSLRLADEAHATSGESIVSQSGVIDRLSVTTATDGRAVVEVEASRAGVSRGATGKVEEFKTVYGPVVVRENSRGWHVSNYFVNGFWSLDGYFLLETEALRLGGLDVQPVALQRRWYGSRLYLRLRNHSEVDARLAEAGVRVRKWSGVRNARLLAFLPDFDLEPNVEAVAPAIFSPQIPFRKLRRVFVTTRVDDAEVEGWFDLRFRPVKAD
jgi:hypothetical protein